MDPYRIFIVDDHPIFLSGLSLLLSEIEECTLAGKAGSGEEFLEMLNEACPDVVLMDIKLPGMSGIEATRQALQKQPQLKVIALTMFEEAKYTHLMREAGAKGMLSKNSGKDTICEAVARVMAGGTYFDKSLPPDLAAAVKVNAPEALSTREKEVLQMLCRGASTATIAEALNISPRTVEGHRANLLLKTGTNNTAALVVLAVKIGLIE
jgi:DNA-binding NarL/FixJ family response regulator